MSIGVLGNEGSWYVAELQRAAARRGRRCTRLEFPSLAAFVANPGARLLHAGETLESLDALIVRTMPPGSLEQVVFRMDLLARLEARGTVVLNPVKAVECAVDKFLTTARLQAAGLPVPRTFACENAEAALQAFEHLGGDVVIKPLFGSEGRGILRASDPDLALRACRTLARLGAVLYLQEFVPHEGFDIRLLVLDGQILGGMKRRSAADWRTNVSREARPEPHECTAVEIDYALRATAAVGARFAGVDLLPDRRGELHVIEVNAVPGWRAFQKVTGLDVADRVMDAIGSRD